MSIRVALLLVFAVISAIGVYHFYYSGQASVKQSIIESGSSTVNEHQVSTANFIGATSIKKIIPQTLIQTFVALLQDRMSVSADAKTADFSKLELEVDMAQDTILVGDKLGGIFLQAPHSMADKYTGDIVEKLIASTVVIDAAFINKRHRREYDYSAESPNILSDLSVAYSEHTKGGTVVQIHGFAQAKRKSNTASNADFIVSSGHKGVLRLSTKFAECLRNKGFSGVEVFGKSVNELGATQNVVKRALYENGFHRFLHIEISLQQRLKLKNSAEERGRFAQCLIHLVSG